MANINDMAWLTGSWKGTTVSSMVEETWMPPLHGCMEMMIRLSSPDAVTMTEFIVVKEIEDEAGHPSLCLHLKQFDAEQNTVTDQTMRLDEGKEGFVSFSADADSKVIHLSYSHLPDGGLSIAVMTNTASEVVTAVLQRV